MQPVVAHFLPIEKTAYIFERGNVLFSAANELSLQKKLRRLTCNNSVKCLFKDSSRHSPVCEELRSQHEIKWANLQCLKCNPLSRGQPIIVNSLLGTGTRRANFGLNCKRYVFVLSQHEAHITGCNLLQRCRQRRPNSITDDSSNSVLHFAVHNNAVDRRRLSLGDAIGVGLFSGPQWTSLTMAEQG
jgi:hypothetical protein